MSVVLLLVFICISFLIVRIGAIALEMTGMEKAMARFQALSAFSGTGFTTREAERIVNHPRRRKIVTYLIILGNAGIVSVIATFVLSLRGAGAFRPSLNLVIIIASLFVLYRVATHQEVAKKISGRIREILKEKFHFESGHIEEILQQAEGYGVAYAVVGKGSKTAGATLRHAIPKDAGVMVLSIEREHETVQLPSPQSKIRAGDRLVCYGKLEKLKGIV